MSIKAKGDYINGKFVRRKRPDGEIRSVDPGSRDSVVGVFPTAGIAVAEALAAARAAAPGWAALEAEQRIAVLRKLKAELRNRTEDLSRRISRETGRPSWDALSEARQASAVIDDVIRHGLPELSLKQTPPAGCRVEFRPLGVVAVISPHSQPALLMHADAVAALAAGCTVVCKPSPLTPAVGQLYAEMMHEADFPRGVFNLIQGEADAGAALAVSPQTDAVLFSGREATGDLLRRFVICGDALVDRALEGEESGAREPGADAQIHFHEPLLRLMTTAHPAALVLDDADLTEAAYAIAIGACLGAGQRCTTTRRVIVQRRVAAPLRERLVSLLSGLKVGHPKDRSVFMGPLVDSDALADHLDQLDRFRRAGVEVVLGGGPTDAREGSFVSPALFELTAAKLREMDHDRELIGPTLLLCPAESVEEGLDLVNRAPRQLTNSLFTRSARMIEHVRHRAGGMLLVNRPTTDLQTDLPLQAISPGGARTSIGVMTSRLCTRLCVSVEGERTFDLTMVPPGMPRER